MIYVAPLFNILATWILRPIFAIFLTLDGIVYSLVAYSYKLFLIMSRLNFNVILTWVEPLITRIEAIIAVLVMFKLGMALIQYMLNPDKVSESKVGGAALVKNIIIAAALLVSYQLFFSVANDLSLLVLGAPPGYTGNDSPLTKIANIDWSQENSQGLITRFVFGETDDNQDFGTYLAVITLQTFLHGKDINFDVGGDVVDSSAAGLIYGEILEAATTDGGQDFNMMKIYDLEDDINRDVEYKWPLVSTALGLFLIYSIVKIAIEVGVRMFKLIILQILAPLAIITIIQDGLDSKVWKNYIDTFGKTFVDVFIRVGSMLITSAFISKFYYGLKELSTEAEGVTGFFILIIVIVAGYRFALLLPKFIDSVLGSKLSENNSKGFGKFVGGIAGGIAGATTGLVAGLTSGTDFLGTIGNMGAGAIGGIGAGTKGKNVAEFFKNTQANNTKNRERALNISRAGGGLRYAGHGFEHALGFDRRQAERSTVYDDNNKLIDNLLNARVNEIKDQDYNGIKFGDNSESFGANFAEKDEDYLKSKADYDALLSSGNANSELLGKKKNIMDEAYSKAKELGIQVWETKAVNTSGTAVKTARADLNAAKRRGTMAKINGKSSQASLEAAKKENSKKANAIRNRGATRRENRSGRIESPK